MSEYVPTEWANGDIITSEKLNKIEQGIKNIRVNPLINLQFRSFSDSGVSFYPAFAIIHYDDGQNEYVAEELSIGGTESSTLFQVGAVIYNSKDLLFASPLPALIDGQKYLVFVENFDHGDWSVTVDGNISNETIEINYGSTANARIITGDCTITITAL